MFINRVHILYTLKIHCKHFLTKLCDLSLHHEAGLGQGGESSALTLGTKFKGVPKILAIKGNYILMQHF